MQDQTTTTQREAFDSVSDEQHIEFNCTEKVFKSSDLSKQKSKDDFISDNAKFGVPQVNVNNFKEPNSEYRMSTPITHNLNGLFDSNSALSPFIHNNVHNCDFNKMIVKGKNLFNANNNFESPYRNYGSSSHIQFSPSPLNIKVLNSASINRTLEFDNNYYKVGHLNYNENIEISTPWKSRIKSSFTMNSPFFNNSMSISKKENYNLLSHVNFENQKEIKQKENLTIKIIKNQKFIQNLTGVSALNHNVDSNLISTRDENSSFIGNKNKPSYVMKKINFELDHIDANVTYDTSKIKPKEESDKKPTSFAITKNPNKTVCKCKKSKCLQFYCECFINGETCQDCNCTDCHNTLEYQDERNKAISNAMQKNPNAFKPKINENEMVHLKGCNCTKSNCQKKYCECYQSGIGCTETCKCKDCKNIKVQKDSIVNVTQAAKLEDDNLPNVVFDQSYHSPVKVRKEKHFFKTDSNFSAKKRLRKDETAVVNIKPEEIPIFTPVKIDFTESSAIKYKKSNLNSSTNKRIAESPIIATAPTSIKRRAADKPSYAEFDTSIVKKLNMNLESESTTFTRSKAGK